MHINPNKIIEHIVQRYYIKNIRKAAEQVFRDCEKCQLGKDVSVKSKRHIPVYDSRPGQTFHMDILYLPPVEGYRYLLVMTCIHSGYLFAKKIKDKQGKTVAEALYKMQVKHALSMVRLVTDKGSEFNCDIMKSLCKTAMIDIEYLEPARGFKNASHAERQNK